MWNGSLTRTFPEDEADEQLTSIARLGLTPNRFNPSSGIPFQQDLSGKLQLGLALTAKYWISSIPSLHPL